MVCRIMAAGTKLYCCESKLQRQLNYTAMQSKLQLQEGYVIPEMSPNMYWAASEPVLTMNYGSTARGGVAPPRRVSQPHHVGQIRTVRPAVN